MIANLIKVKDSIIAIGKTKLGILCLEIGMRSIRLGVPISMYLAKVQVFSIMQIRQWSSTAFLKNIRKQVQEFSHGISSKMIEVRSFKHVQNTTSTHPMESIVRNWFLLLMR
jgi:hypothetical protein